ncbi:MAG: hypothetical protein AB1451_15135 [Nitrospirota bacterium]
MEERPLKEHLAKLGPPSPISAQERVPRPWFNPFGDCIEFQSESVAVVADRIDDFLTLYRSAENNEVIGFQLKDVTALLRDLGYQDLEVRWSMDDKRIVSLTALLLKAYGRSNLTIHRLSGYSQAIRTIEDDEVEVETASAC